MEKGVMKKILISIMISFILVGNITTGLGTVTVFAEGNENEENEETEDENTENEEDYEDDDGEGDDRVDPSKILSGKGNLYGLGTKKHAVEARELLEDAAQYDIRLQFLITYGFLKDEYGAVNGSSTYHEYFYPKNSSNNSVFNDLITSPAEIISNRTEEELTDIHGGESEESEDEIDIDKLLTEFAKVLAEEHVDLIISTYGIAPKEVDKLWEDRYDGEDGSNPVGNMGYKIPNYAGDSTFFTDGSSTAEAREFLEGKYTSFYKEKLSNVTKEEVIVEGYEPEAENLIAAIGKVFDVHDGDRTLRRFVDLYRDYKGVVPYYTEIDINAGDSWTGIGALGTKGGFVSEKRIPDAWDNRFLKGKKDV